LHCAGAALRQELVKRDFPPKLKAYLSGRRTREKAGAQKS